MKKVLIILSLVIIFLTGCSSKNKYSALEKELTDKATKYYEDYLKDKVLGVNNHQITLELLDAANVDISNFKKKYCDRSSYALIILEFNENGELTDNFKVENHLTCGKYTTKNENK